MPGGVRGHVVVVGGLVGVLFRDHLLSRAVRRREGRVLAGLPTVEELLALLVSAGEEAVGALERVAKSSGELTRELRQTLADARASLVQSIPSVGTPTYDDHMLEVSPFRPGKRVTDPEFFSGRKNQLQTATRVLLAAAQGNARHALVTGERGIGKSSFSSQVQGIAKAETPSLALADVDPYDFPYVFLTSEHIAQKGQTPADVMAGLLRGLEHAKGLARFVRLRLDFTVDLGVVSSTVRSKDADPQEITSKFVDEIAKIWRHVEGKVHGIVLVVDEVDSIAGRSGVSTFFKVATEMLTARGLNNICFFLVGLRGTLEALTAEHPSVGRIFRPLEVPTMNPAESREVLIRALDTTSVRIDEAAAKEISDLAGGFPNALHLLGEQAFEIVLQEGEHLIDLGIVDRAKLAAVDAAEDEDFGPRYAKIQGRSRQIVRYMAEQEERDVPSASICAAIKVRPTDVSANFDTMLRQDVLERPSNGIYRLRDPLFRVYVQQLVLKGVEPAQRRPQTRGA